MSLDIPRLPGHRPAIIGGFCVSGVESSAAAGRDRNSARVALFACHVNAMSCLIGLLKVAGPPADKPSFTLIAHTRTNGVRTAYREHPDGRRLVHVR